MRDLLDADLGTEIDQEKRQEFGQAPEDRRVDIPGQSQQALARLFCQSDQKSDKQANRQCRQGKRKGHQNAARDIVTPTLGSETDKGPDAHALRQLFLSSAFRRHADCIKHLCSPCKSGGFAAICVKVEIFVVDFLVLSIGADRLDGGVELFTQRVLALANGNANTVAKVLLDRGYRAGNLAAGAVVSLQPLLKDNDIVV